ncbi:MAG: phosphatase PAP2 family protein [Proteobacteria bacterium]|nr:MAG: phosphatase PAP2 family protein [Pseudomonadota bacterium]
MCSVKFTAFTAIPRTTKEPLVKSSAALLLASICFFSGCAGSTTEKQTDPKKWAFWEKGGYYVKAESLPEGLVPPPPAAGSSVDKEDLAELEAWQKKRTDKLCEEVIAQKRVEPDTFFKKLPFEPKSSAEAVLLKIRADVGQAVSRYKAEYARARPFLREPDRFKPCYPEGHGTSYPSGHAAISQAYALALGDLDPAHRTLYLNEAKQAGLYRVIGGVHHPSDIRAGAELGAAVYARIKQTPEFRKELASLQGRALEK